MARLPGSARSFRTPSVTTAVTAAVVGAAVLFVFLQLDPRLLLRNTTPSGGDMGAHVWMPAYLRDHLLTHGRLTGWTPDWYGGFPALVFYFPLPSLLIVALSTILPYGIAFKLITVLGVLTLPVSAWAFGRLAGMRAPGPACLAVATVPFLFDRTFTIYGGNIPSTLAGEFAFSISLSLTLLFLGVFARGLATGKYRALAAGLLALVALCHIVPTFFAIVAAALLLALHFDKDRLRWALPVLVVGGALVAFWVLPFLLRIAYTNDMGWEKLVNYRTNLIPHNDRWVALLALAGAVVSLALRRRTGTFLGLLAVASALGFRFAPQGRLWNARLLPFWMLTLYLLAGVAVAELGRALGKGWDRLEVEPVAAHGPEYGPLDHEHEHGHDGDGDHEPAHEHALNEHAHTHDHERVTLPATRLAPRSTNGERNAGWVTPAIALVLALWLVSTPLHIFDKKPVLSAFFHSKDRSFIPAWVKWNYSGYEGKPAYPEYRALISTMTDVGHTHGCGRAMWEYEPELDRLGTPMALMLLPHWTDGCIGSMEGLFFESSATTPYHFLNQAELSMKPSSAMRDLPYRSLAAADQRQTVFDQGIQHLQLLGVRYYMAIAEETKQAARNNRSLQLVARSGPWSVDYARPDLSGTQSRTWEVYQVAGSDLVSPLTRQPAVMQGVAKGGKPWLRAAVGWYQDTARQDVPLAVSGPANWPRVNGADPNPPRVPVAPATVTNIRTTDDRISFDVDRPGTPVLVKASYFPNWHASGATGPWRVSPNLMVVVPTSTHVSLHYGWTPVDLSSWLITLLGLAGLVWLWRRGRVDLPEPALAFVPVHEPEPTVPAYALHRAGPPLDPLDPDADAFERELARSLAHDGVVIEPPDEPE